MYSTLLGTNISTEGYVNTYCWFFSKEEKQSVFKYLVWERNRVTKQIFWHSPKISFSELATWSNWKKQFPLHSGFMDSGAIWKKEELCWVIPAWILKASYQIVGYSLRRLFCGAGYPSVSIDWLFIPLSSKSLLIESEKSEKIHHFQSFCLCLHCLVLW